MRTVYNPAPVSGWYASVPLDLMPPTSAVKMVNWIPRETYIEMRRGSEKLTTSALGTAVETMATHREEDGTETLLCASDGNIYSVNTTTGATTSEGSGYSNNRWQTVNFNDLLLFVNGADAPLQYNGTTLATYAAPITGATAADLKGVTVFKGRCYYWENNASKFWYAAAGSYGGALTSFPLSFVTKKGGYVVECCSYSRDAGDGVDDYFVVIMSTGETLLYQGSDPGAAQDWQLVGSFNLGEPLSFRGSTNLASDRIIITRDGFINLSTALQVGRVTDKGHISTNIIEAAKDAARQHKNKYGWEVIYHDAQSLLIVNIPVQDGERYEQYCMNTNTGAWCQFKDIDAITYTEHNGDLYAGSSDGHIRKMFSSAGDDGNAINYVLIPAFSNYGMPDRQKNFTYVTVQTNFIDKDNIGMAAITEFNTASFGNAAIPDLSAGSGAEWDDADWDDAYWADSDLDVKDVFNYDIPVSQLGYALSCKMKMSTNVQTAKLYSLRYKYRIGRSI